MQLFLKCCLLMLIVLLSACHWLKPDPVPYQYPKCVRDCRLNLQDCKSNCKNNCYNCQGQACQVAISRYKSYIHTEKIKGGYIARDLKSYQDPLQCRKVTCNCSADYNICLQACSGIIRKGIETIKTC